MNLRITVLILLALLLLSCNKREENAADIVFLNGNIVTMADNIPKVEAVAIHADTIQDLGTNKSIKELIGENTKVIDLKDRFVMPGFFESHAHFYSVGESKLELDLSTANNWDEIIALVVEASEKVQAGGWIVGRGWHQEKWDPIPIDNVEGYPTNKVLSEATPYNPVLLKHASGHALFANKLAMKLANVDTAIEVPEGGRIVADSLGNFIGVFEEEAMQLIYNEYDKYLEKRSDKEVYEHRKKVVKLAVDECLKFGITSFEDAGSTFEEVDFYKSLVDSGKLPIRLNVMLHEPNEKLAKKIKDYRIINYGNNHLTVRAIKAYIDGALGSRTAWMINDYDDLPGNKGLNVTPLNTLKKTANIAMENGFQMCTHAIGDRGNHEILKIYEKAFERNSEKTDLRWRVEHAQHLAREDIKRFSKLKVIAAMQGVHATSDGPFVRKRLGRERAKRGAYVWRKLLDSGAIICNGTDAPIESLNTIENYFSSVTRIMSDGNPFFPEEKMTRIEALKSYTINGAYAAFHDDILGSLEIGKLADLAVLSGDITTVQDYAIKKIKVDMTMVGGKIIYSAN